MKNHPLLTKNTWKSFAGFFMVVMWCMSVIAVIQTLTSCATAYKFAGTTLAVYEAFSYCGMVWGVSYLLMTVVWTMLVATMFIIGRFVGDPTPQDATLDATKMEAPTEKVEAEATDTETKSEDKTTDTKDCDNIEKAED